MVLQVLAPHWYAPHEDDAWLQAPAPSQVPTEVAAPALQLADPHEIAAPGYRHALTSLPLQVALHGPLPSHAPREPCGSPSTGVHVPFTTSHAAHLPPHAPLQQ